MVDIPLIHVVAMDRANGIGYQGNLPWPRISSDMKRFKQLTQNNPVVMGRKTFESIGFALPNRTNIVVTRQPKFLQSSKDIKVVSSIDQAIITARNTPKARGVFIIGGSELYVQTINTVKIIHLTIVDGEYSADAYYPQIPAELFSASSRQEINENPRLTFLTLVRKG